MYTQCPDCSTAFRVTADVLKQAAGKVRCGGCGSAFNALEYLSERMPETPAAKEPEPSLPELTPEPLKQDPELPQSVSAEQSAALLKTLDELAGSDIRIEDTGIEWRVLDDDDSGEAGIDDGMTGMFATHVTTVDEMLDESPTPVDQFLTATPNDIEAAEIFEESANGPARTPVDELRFDDNTPLPDDFDLDSNAAYAPEPAPAAEPGSEPTFEEPKTDLELSEPEEWTDILDEFDVLGEPTVPPLVVELDALETEPETAGDESYRADEILDVDTQFALQAEAMGIDLTGAHESPDVDTAEETTAADEDQSDQPEAAAADGEPPDVPEAAAADDAESDVAEDEQPDAVEAIATGEAPASDQDEDIEQLDLIEDEEHAGQDEVPLEFGSIEREIAELENQSNVFDEELFDSASDAREDVEAEAEAAEDDAESIEEFEIDEDLALEDQPDLKSELDFTGEPYPEEELDLDDAARPAADEDSAEDDRETVHVVPPMTEEEQTINMMIDQDLMSMAVEDEDGFASTIVIPGKEPKTKSPKKEKKKRKDKKKKKKKDKPEIEPEAQGFETIIMEGEFVRSALDEDRFESQAAEAAAMVEQAKAEEAAIAAQSRGKRIGLIGGVVALVLLLLIQGVHHSREKLATIPALNSVISPIYRLIGKPLSPSWDVSGWRFEATQPAPQQESEALTLYSRLGNTSDKPLPYPLITVSLTDRFEDVIGSRTLDPAEYLAAGLDPSRFVAPGENFEAVISIESPAEQAAGYKLMPCYRSGGQLRCHSPTFK